jgi:hypothetical protein
MQRSVVLLVSAIGLPLCLIRCSSLDNLAGGSNPDAGGIDASGGTDGGADEASATYDGSIIDAVTCAPNLALCGSTCTALYSDTSNCGSCGHACGPTEVCAAGKCGVPYYLSPLGADTNPGTRTAPVKTFAYAIPKLVPGNALILLDGTYELTTTGLPRLECGPNGNAKNGTPNAPIGLGR